MGISSSSNQIAVTVIQIIQYNSLTYYGALTKYGTDIPLAACGINKKVCLVNANRAPFNAFPIAVKKLEESNCTPFTNTMKR